MLNAEGPVLENCASAISAKLLNLDSHGMGAHLVFECQALQGLHDEDPDLVGEHAVTLVKVMWQAD